MLHLDTPWRAMLEDIQRLQEHRVTMWNLKTLTTKTSGWTVTHQKVKIPCIARILRIEARHFGSKQGDQGDRQ